MSGYRYKAFGLVFGSAEQIPSMSGNRVPADTIADVDIVYGPVAMPGQLEDFCGHRAGGTATEFFLDVEDSARFRVSDGRQIAIDPHAGASPAEVDAFLVGSAFGIVMHQRSILVLHCNAIAVGDRAFLFCGDSGAGKSTSAAYFRSLGHRMITDDLCALSFDDGKLVALPGIARLKLWQDALNHLGLTAQGLNPIPWEDNKFEMRLDGAPVDTPLPVAAILHLREADHMRQPGIWRLPILGAMNTLTANIYRRRFAEIMGHGPFYLATAARIASLIPILSMNRRWGFEHFPHEVAATEKWMDSFEVGSALPNFERSVVPF